MLRARPTAVRGGRRSARWPDPDPARHSAGFVSVSGAPGARGADMNDRDAAQGLAWGSGGAPVFASEGCER